MFTRTRDFADGFSESLSLVDRLLLLDIYPARELPIEGVNSEMLLGKVEIEDKHLVSKKDVLDLLPKLNTDIVVTIGAGDIDTLVGPIKNILQNPFSNN